MAGRYLDISKVTIRPSGDLSSFPWESLQYNEANNQGKILEEHSDGPSQSSYPGVPYLWSNISQRTYCKSDGRVLSYYSCTRPYDIPFCGEDGQISFRDTISRHLIVIMGKGAFAAGLYHENKLVDTIELYDRIPNSTPGQEKQFQNNVKTALDKWNTRFYVKFIRCRKEDFYLFEDGEYNIRHWYSNRSGCFNQHIPFITDYPSVDEVERVNKRLFTIVDHGTVREFHGKEKKMLADFTNRKNSTKPYRSTQDRRGPRPPLTIDIDRVKRLILENDGSALETLLSSQKSYEMVMGFVNSAEIEGTNLLHFATVRDRTDVVQVLLEFGADPAQPDSPYASKGKMPYEVTKTDDMRKVFIQLREKKPDVFLWKKAKVPTIDEFEEAKRPPVVITEDDVKAERRVLRDANRHKRREKLDKKKVHRDDY